MSLPSHGHFHNRAWRRDWLRANRGMKGAAKTAEKSSKRVVANAELHIESVLKPNGHWGLKKTIRKLG